MKKAASLLLGAALAATIAAPASADSIAYVKDGDVWLSTGDGARQFQVTTTGGYADVSQADDGTMIALHGVRLHRLDRLGNVLADFDTPVSDTRPAGSRTFYGPFDPAISPDGTKVAYTYFYSTTSQSPTCFPPECVTAINEGGTGYSHADRQTGWDEPGFHKHSGWRNPAWVDDVTTMLSDPTHLPNDDVVIDDRTKPAVGLVNGWFSDTVEDNAHLSGGDVTRAKDKLAFASGRERRDAHLLPRRLLPDDVQGRRGGPGRPAGGLLPLHAAGRRALRDADLRARRHARGADRRRHPRRRRPGLHAAAARRTARRRRPRLLIPGATQPDWGPADVPASRPAPQPVTPIATPGPTATPATPARTCRVPKVKGLTVKRAKRKVAAAGCRVRRGGAGATSASRASRPAAPSRRARRSG